MRYRSFFVFVSLFVMATGLSLYAAEPVKQAAKPKPAAKPVESPPPVPELLVTVAGKPLDFFEAEKLLYVYYLPYDTMTIPEVGATPKSGSVKIVKSDKDRTVQVIHTLGYQSPKTYTIRFEQLAKLDLFLCIGQSNMAGRGPMDEKRGDKDLIPNVYLMTPAGNWEPACNPLNKYSTTRKHMGMQQIGPSYMFAKKVAAVTKRPIGLVVNAKGGTTINAWLKTSNDPDHLYAEAMKRALEAKRWGEYKAILWHQGEGNSGRWAAYPEQLKTLVADLRQDLGDAKLFFVAGEIARWRKSSNGGDPNANFNAMIGKIGTYFEHAGLATTEGLKPLKGDITDPHFDRESNLILGERYADVVLQNVYGIGK